MDAIEDDARYPPNSYPQNHRHAHRPKLPVRNPPFHPQIARNFPQDDDDDDEFDEDEKNDIDQPMNDAELDDDDDDDDIGDGGRSYRRIREDSDEDDDSSSESRGKRRRLDKFAMGFEFAPRAPPPPLPKPAVRNSPPDWSEDSTFVLLDAWGDLFVQNGRKSLRSDEWSEVAKKVNQSSKTTRSDSQCRNRLDTLKKKYKKEKARMAEHLNSGSKWVYFKKMDSLISSPSPPPAAVASQQNSPPRLPCGVDAGEYVFTSSRVYLNRSNGMDEMRDSPGDTGTDGEDEEDDDDESDGLPPMMREKGRGSSGSSFRMLADSIQKFGEIYEKIENSKQQQMVELERMRKEFHRDLEAQKRQILERAQAEIARIRQEEGEEEEEEDGMEDGDGSDDDDDEIDGSAENLSG